MAGVVDMIAVDYYGRGNHACIILCFLDLSFRNTSKTIGQFEEEGRSSGHENGFKGLINTKSLYSCK
jgi:hypothetical protein